MPLVAHPVRSLWGSQLRCARCVCEWLHRKWDGAFSLSLLITKRNPYIIENTPSVLFWAFIGYVPISVVFMLIMETPVLPSNWFDTVMIIVHSCTCPGLFALYIYGPKYISGNTFTLILTTDLIFMLIAQYTVLSSILPGYRNWMEVVGVVLVLLECSMSTILEIIKGI